MSSTLTATKKRGPSDTNNRKSSSATTARSTGQLAQPPRASSSLGSAGSSRSGSGSAMPVRAAPAKARSTAGSPEAGGGKTLSVSFEIFGKVQGVYFRKHTEERARQLGLVGWVENTPSGSVRGQAQGREADIVTLKHWLAETGSPKSRIDRAVFSEEEEVELSPGAALAFERFEVRR